MSRWKRAEIQRRELWAAVEAELGDTVICRRCGTTLKGYTDTCSAMLDEQCEGFRCVDEVQSRHYLRLLGSKGAILPRAQDREAGGGG